ncbi:MAG TPA: ATP phosphoribosyltransferase, partial [Rhizobiales bacterium]|nr:ATP phosphoribosyltransferase [Hyphomicrobiales bacterium]
MSKYLTIALPSKGRLMEKAQELFSQAGYEITRIGSARGYQGKISGIDNAEIAFLSAGEIAQSLMDGSIDAGVTGEDLLRETIPDTDKVVDMSVRLGFGHADVIVALPKCWLDVATMADLDEVCESWYARHNRRLRVATKYLRITRRFFADKGVTGYRIVESLGATEGAPASGTAQVIVDITSTGSTLEANNLKILDDGLIFQSEAVLGVTKAAMADPRIAEMQNRLKKV